MKNKKQIVGFTANNFDLIHPGYIYTFESQKNIVISLLYSYKETLTNIESQSTNQLYHYMKDIVHLWGDKIHR